MGKWAASLALVRLRIFFDVLFACVVESFYRKADSLTIGSFSLTNRGKLSRTHAAGVPFLRKNRPFAVILRGHLPELQIESNGGITSHDVIKRIYELKPYNVITRNGYPFGQRDFTIYIYIYKRHPRLLSLLYFKRDVSVTNFCPHVSPIFFSSMENIRLSNISRLLEVVSNKLKLISWCLLKRSHIVLFSLSLFFLLSRNIFLCNYTADF